MSELAATYHQWILAQDIEDMSIEEKDDEHIDLRSDSVDGCANFYDIDDATIVELRLESRSGGEPLFFLHFELLELERAQMLFNEMRQTYEKTFNTSVRHVLLCCSCGITTTFFANKLNETARTLEVDYDFCAMPLDQAKEQGSEFVAVLLAPQVGHLRQSVVEALPNTLVIELPVSIFGAYDATAALNLVIGAVSGARAAARSDLRMARDFDRSKCVLAICYVYREDESTLSYSVLDRGERSISGMLVRSHFDTLILDDLAATLRVAGYPPDGFDAIGIGVPNMTDKGVLLTRLEHGYARFDLAQVMRERWGVPVFVDNNATAAAAGCYVSQGEWDDVAFHAQTIGVPACDEGLVIGGLPRAGLCGFAGSLKYLSHDFSLSMDLNEAAWRYDGTLELVARYLAATICVVAPQAIFVWCDLVPDMEELREELHKTIPSLVIPQLVAVSDYDGLVLMGELSLCLQRLATD